MQQGGSGQVDMNLPRLIGQYVSADSKWEFPASLNETMGDIFSATGRYTVIFYGLDIDGNMLTPKTASIYVNSADNRAPAQPQLQLPVPDASVAVQDPYIVFQWSAVTDPDSDPFTYTLDICGNSTCTGTPLKRYEQLGEEGMYLDTSIETLSDGRTLLFNGGTTYYWQATAIDNKGMGAASAPGHFAYSPQNTLPGVLYGHLTDSATGAPIAGATIKAGASTTAITMTNGAFLMLLTHGSYRLLATAATGYQLQDFPLVVITAGGVTNPSLTLVPVAPSGKPGDCNGDGRVSISEVQSALNMFLGLTNVSTCAYGSGVSIGGVQKVINSFLGQ